MRHVMNDECVCVCVCVCGCVRGCGREVREATGRPHPAGRLATPDPGRVARAFDGDFPPLAPTLTSEGLLRPCKRQMIQRERAA